MQSRIMKTSILETWPNNISLKTNDDIDHVDGKLTKAIKREQAKTHIYFWIITHHSIDDLLTSFEKEETINTFQQKN